MHSEFPASPASRASASGFSLPEVAMAIGIIAIAFVALIGLLPVGLNTYRAAIDESNETWILQSMNSMIQTTDFSHIQELDYQKSGEIYYYDEGAKLTDKETKPGSEQARASRIYAVKLLVDRMYRPDEQSFEESTQLMPHAWRVIGVMAPYLNPAAMNDFRAMSDAKSLRNLSSRTVIRTKVFYVARMDSQPLTTPQP
jgi:uncharacterized protein (TIGR02598 family)